MQFTMVCFLFSLSTKRTKTQYFKIGHIFLATRGMHFSVWSFDFNLDKDIQTIVLVWVNLPHLLLSCWSDECLKVKVMVSVDTQIVLSLKVNNLCVPKFAWRYTLTKVHPLRLSCPKGIEVTFNCLIMRNSHLNLRIMANMAIFPKITKLLSLKMEMEWLYHRKT